jgi:hypothetical protein
MRRFSRRRGFFFFGLDAMKTFQFLVAVAILIVGFAAANCRAAEEKGKAGAKAEKAEKSGTSSESGAKLHRAEQRYAPLPDGKARTAMFGVEATGYRFVYLIDRSGSMGGDGNAALKAAKAELLASIGKLESTHSFQIVFYNERTARFDPKGNGQTVFANDGNKEAAERFLDSISAQGGTEHEAALRIALKLKPDAVFWLTDADRPKLDDEQIARINHFAAGTVVHSIEFGSGPKKEESNFLKKIAAANAGEHVYVDVRKLGGK